MGLLVHWITLLEGEEIDHSGNSWLVAAHRWLRSALTDLSDSGCVRIRRFLELIEANTSGLTEMIDIAASGQEPLSQHKSENPVVDETDDDQIGADESVASAYESMVWEDSADDGIDGGMLDVDLPAGRQVSSILL